MTPEQLLMQILAAVLLINDQGKWFAFFEISGHVGKAIVRIVPADQELPDFPDTTSEAWERKSVFFTPTVQHPNPELTAAIGADRLIGLLDWTKNYLTTEPAA